MRRQTKGVIVFIRGEGRLSYQVVPVDAFRLVLDFPGGTSSLSFKVLPIKHAILNRIRIGQDGKKLRLVFDLTKRVKFAIKEGIGFLAVQFKS